MSDENGVVILDGLKPAEQEDGLAGYATPPHRVDRAPSHRAIVLDRNETVSSIASKLASQAAELEDTDAGAYDATLIRAIDAVAGFARGKAAEVGANASLSPEGRREALAPALLEALEKLEAHEAEAAKLEANADSMEADTQDMYQPDVDQHGAPVVTPQEQDFAMRQFADEARRDPRAFQARVFAASRVPRSHMTRADAVLVDSIMKAADVGAPLVDAFTMAGMYEALKKDNPRNADIKASRTRAGRIRAQVGASRAVLRQVAEAYKITLDPDVIRDQAEGR